MPTLPPAAFPFIEVNISTKGLQPAAQRSPGVIAVVGVAGAATTPENTPTVIGSSAEAIAAFGATGALTASLSVALKQNPRASKIYGVRAVAGTSTTPPKYAEALASLEGADDVTFVSLANESDVGGAGERLKALLKHVEDASADGNKRIGVAMVDPSIQKSATPNYVDNVKNKYQSIKSTVSRLVLVAARGAVDSDDNPVDVATAAMSAIAGHAPHISPVLKPIFGVKIPVASQFGASEIKKLSDENIIPIIDPALIPGESLHFAEGRCYTTLADLLYVDTIRMLDQVDFELKAGLIGTVGDARITKSGMLSVKVRTEAILEVLMRNEVIAGYGVQIPVLDMLSIPEAARSPADNKVIADARSTRVVEMIVSITYGPAVHFLRVTLAPKFT
jgi:hypothetical protein